MPAAVQDKGFKRICPSCGARYYDFNQRPIKCPGCAVEFTLEQKVKARRGRVAALPEDDTNGPDTAARKGRNADGEEDDNTTAVEGDEDTVSLNEVEEMEDAEADGDEVDADIDVEDDLEDIEDLDEDLEDEDVDVGLDDEDKI